MAVSDPVRKIVVAGGGTAGWMVAAFLGRHFRRQPVVITVVESSEIGTIGVGEATVPAILEYFREIGIESYEVMRATQGTIKLGIEFEGWARPGLRAGFRQMRADIGKSVSLAMPHEEFIAQQCAAAN